VAARLLVIVVARPIVMVIRLLAMVARPIVIVVTSLLAMVAVAGEEDFFHH
jgi:uncharacterized membrane protein YhhN